MKKNHIILIGSLFSVLFVSNLIIPILIPNSTISFLFDTSCRTNSEKTLYSLKKIDPIYPFYAMRYYGDYGFLDVLENGTELISEFEVQEGWGCTCFSALNSSSDPVFGRNFDWMDEGSLFLYTEPSYGYASISTINLGILGIEPSINIKDPTTQKRLLLTPYYLMDGINEMGLVVGIMAISRASRTYNTSQPTISSLDIVRLALEFATTVDEVLVIWENYNIEFGSVPIHYLIADPTGKSAIVEWIDGNMNIYRNEQSWQVSTNFIFTDGITPCWRYQTATELLHQSLGSVTMQHGMDILKACSQDGWTLWSNVYNLRTRQVHISVNQNYQKIYRFHF